MLLVRRIRASRGRLSPMLRDAPPFLADDALQLGIIDTDAKSSCHLGGACPEWLTPGQSNPTAVLLRGDTQGGFEAFIALVAHDDLHSHVAEDLAAIGSAINDDVPHRIDFRPQATDGERPLRRDLIPHDALLALLASLSILDAPQGCSRGFVARGGLPLDPAAPHLPTGEAVGQSPPFGSLAVL